MDTDKKEHQEDKFLSAFICVHLRPIVFAAYGCPRANLGTGTNFARAAKFGPAPGLQLMPIPDDRVSPRFDESRNRLQKQGPSVLFSGGTSAAGAGRAREDSKIGR